MQYGAEIWAAPASAACCCYVATDSRVSCLARLPQSDQASTLAPSCGVQCERQRFCQHELDGESSEMKASLYASC
eukprot:6183768-Pleurochrysis_carterae.AAC.6